MNLTKLILIGASTGGPGILNSIIKKLPPLQECSIVIAQHMPEIFLQNFAKALDEKGSNSVMLVKENMLLEAGSIYLLPSSFTLEKKSENIAFYKAKIEGSFNPDINLFATSLIEFTQNLKIMFIILTGIGDDGTNAAKLLEARGVSILTEDGKNTIVDGMPSSIRREIQTAKSTSIEEIIEKIGAFYV